MQLKTFLKKACRQNIKAAGGRFLLVYNFLQGFKVNRIMLYHVKYWFSVDEEKTQTVCLV